MSSFRSFFLRSPSDWKFWIFLVLLVKGIIFYIWCIHPTVIPSGGLKGFWGDFSQDRGYIIPIDNLLKYGMYGSPDRLPGYGIIYYVFRLFLSQPVACNVIILLQYIALSVSIYCLALLVKYLLQKDFLFYGVFYFSLVFPLVDTYNVFVIPESFTASFLVFSAYFFVRYFQELKLKHLIISGIFCGYVFLLKPVYLFLLVFYAAILLFKQFRQLKLKAILVNITTFVSFFVVCEGAWIIRNYITEHKFIPLTKHIWVVEETRPQYMPMIYFEEAWGGDFWRWGNRVTPYNWLEHQGQVDNHDSVPAYAYTAKFNRDSLIGVRTLLIALEDTTGTLSTDKKQIYRDEVARKMHTYTESIIHDKPKVYYITANEKRLKDLMLGNFALSSIPDYSATSEIKMHLMNRIIYFLRLNYAWRIAYFLIIMLSILGMLLLIIKSLNDILVLIIPFIPLYTILIHVFVMKIALNRYLIPAYPFLIACAIYALYWLYTQTGKLVKAK